MKGGFIVQLWQYFPEMYVRYFYITLATDYCNYYGAPVYVVI